MGSFFVYILASDRGTLYIGVTNDLLRRMWEHREGQVEGFSKKYGCKKLVFFEMCDDAYVAISREKQLKSWRREKKEGLIRWMNPGWRDLYEDIAGN